MKTKYTIPYNNMSFGTSKQTIKKAIRYLEERYLLDCEYMSEPGRIELLECISDMTNIYLNMKEAKVKQGDQEQ